MVAAVPIKYNFYHSAGDGRDGFIRHVSEHQTGFTYVPKSPEFVGTRMPGMASNTVGLTTKHGYVEAPFAVSGYTGLRKPEGGHEKPTAADAFPNLGPAPKFMASTKESFEAEKRKVQESIQHPSYRIPGYGGLCPGHQQVCGHTQGSICLGEAGPTTLAAIGFDAPGLNTGPQIIKYANLQPDAVVPAGKPRTKAGYTGHLPGKNFSSIFGRNFATTSETLISTDGKPDTGGIPDPGQPYNADTESKLPFPEGHVGRPQRLTTCVSGYAGFRPRTTPGITF